MTHNFFALRFFKLGGILSIFCIIVGSYAVLNPDLTPDSYLDTLVVPVGLVSVSIGIFSLLVVFWFWVDLRNILLNQGRQALLLSDRSDLSKTIFRLGEIGAFSAQKELIKLTITVWPNFFKGKKINGENDE